MSFCICAVAEPERGLFFFFMVKTWILIFKGFLSLDRNGWFAPLKSVSSH